MPARSLGAASCTQMHGPGTETLVLGAGGLARQGILACPLCPLPHKRRGRWHDERCEQSAVADACPCRLRALRVAPLIILSYFLFKDSRSSRARSCSTSALLTYGLDCLGAAVHCACGSGHGGRCVGEYTRPHALRVQDILQFFYLASYVWTKFLAWHLYQVSQECCILWSAQRQERFTT